MRTMGAGGVVWGTVLGLAVWGIGGCAETKPAVQPPSVPPAAAAAAEPAAERPEELVIERLEEKRREPAKRFTLRFKDADVREVLRSFSRTTPFNFIFGPEVQGKVTVELKDVTLDEALKAILFPIQLMFEKDANFIRVHPQQMETRVYSVNYVNSVRTGMTGTFSGGIGGVAGGGVAGGAGGATGGGLTGGGVSGGGGMGASFSTVTSTDQADVFGDLESAIKSMLSKDGKASVNRTAGTVVVTDFPGTLEQVEKYLRLAETMLQRQVRIQANIAEVVLTDEFQYGIDWSAMGKFLGGAGTGALAATGKTGQVIVQNLGNNLTNRFQVGSTGRDFSVILSWMAAQGKVNLVSRPTVSTLNNQRALIQVGKQEVFFQVSSIIPTGLTPGQSFSIPQTVFVGLSLSVTPQIGDDRTITMIILPTESSVVREVPNPIIPPGGGESKVPVVSVREAQAVVRVRNGDTIILGGLMQEKKRQDVTKVPFLGDLPYVGKLFQQVVEKKEKTELVIFLTPTIVEAQTFDAMALEAQKGLGHALE